MPCADLQLPPEADECELNLTDCQGNPIDACEHLWMYKMLMRWTCGYSIVGEAATQFRSRLYSGSALQLKVFRPVIPNHNN
jgi:hypothetical protein